LSELKKAINMIKVDKIKEITVAVVEEMDKIVAFNADTIKKELNAIFNTPGTNLILNLQNVAFIDSTGFGVFLSVYKTATGNAGSMKICCIKPDVMKLFRLLHLDNVFELYDTQEECLNSYTKI